MSNDNFGPLIAYLVPVRDGASGSQSILADPPYLVCFHAGRCAHDRRLPVSHPRLARRRHDGDAVRWAIIDKIHARMGVSIPPRDFSKLGPNVEAFHLLIRIHYEHYQFYANMCVGLAIAYACYRFKLGGMLPLGWLDLGFVLLEVILFAMSRDTLRNYSVRTEQLLNAKRHALPRSRSNV